MRLLRWMQKTFERMRTDHITEAGVVITPFQPITSCFLLVGPADRQIAGGLQIVIVDEWRRREWLARSCENRHGEVS